MKTGFKHRGFIQSWRSIVIGSVIASAMFSASSQAVEAPIVWDGISDPQLRIALYDAYQNKHFESLTHLLAAQKQGRIKDSPERTALVMAGIYLSYGFHREGAQLFEAFLEKDQPLSVQDQAWFYLGKIQFQRKQYAAAQVSLNRIKQKLPLNMEPEKAQLQGLIKMQLGRFREAQPYFKEMLEESNWKAFGQYNLGVAAFKSGDKQRALQLFDQLADSDSGQGDVRALREKANLILGFDYLKQGNNQQAAQYLERMTLVGRHSNRALLALGRVRSNEQQYQASLIPWLELIKRDPSDPSVQQALMGVPFALGKLEAYKQSLQYYELAMRTFQAEIKRINTAAEAVNGGKFIEGLIRARNGELEGGGAFTIDKVLDTPEGRYLWPLVASNEFRETLYNYAELRRTLGKLEVWSASLFTYDVISSKRKQLLKTRISALQSKVLLTTEKLRHHLHSMAYDVLDARKQRLVKYFNDARFAVAQIYDYAAQRWGNAP